MEILILVVQLHRHGPVLAWHVKDCAEASAWMRDARGWQARNHVAPLDGPIYRCGPAREMAGLHVKFP